MVSEALLVAGNGKILLANSAQTGTSERKAERKPFWLGSALRESDYSALEKSWITREIAEAAMLCRVDDYDGREIIGQKGKRDCAGILIHYYRPGTPGPFTYRLTCDNRDWTQGKDGKLKQERKYLSLPSVLEAQDQLVVYSKRSNRLAIRSAKNVTGCRWANSTWPFVLGLSGLSRF
jgi:hypothetical protein